MQINVNKFRTDASYPITLGKQGEGGIKPIEFDYNDWISLYGEGTIALAYQRNGDELAYPIIASIEDGIATWVPSKTDTAKAGDGKMELSYYIGEACKKSATIYTRVVPSLDVGEAPEPYDDWLETLEQITAEVTSARDTAVQSSTEAQASAETAQQSAESALEILEEITPLAEQVHTDAESVSTDKGIVIESALQVAGDATNAAQSARNASASEANAKTSETNAKTSEDNAKISENNAKASADETRRLVEDMIEFTDPNNDGNIVITMSTEV